MKAIVKTKIERPSQEWVDKYRKVPPSIVSDCLNRYYAMSAHIKPMIENSTICGPALTIQSMCGNNLMSHLALTLAQPGDVLVIDARSNMTNAVWGGIQALCAKKKGIAGVVIDGVIRDVAEMRAMRFPAYCRGVTPGGPHKGWADSVNVPVQCGGVPVYPGDLILGDDDGIVVLPSEHLEAVYEEAKVRMKKEQEWKRKIEIGASSLDAVGLRESLDAMEIDYQE